MDLGLLQLQHPDPVWDLQVASSEDHDPIEVSRDAVADADGRQPHALTQCHAVGPDEPPHERRRVAMGQCHEVRRRAADAALQRSRRYARRDPAEQPILGLTAVAQVSAARRSRSAARGRPNAPVHATRTGSARAPHESGASAWRCGQRRVTPGRCACSGSPTPARSVDCRRPANSVPVPVKPGIEVDRVLRRYPSRVDHDVELAEGVLPRVQGGSVVRVGIDLARVGFGAPAGSEPRSGAGWRGPPFLARGHREPAAYARLICVAGSVHRPAHRRSRRRTRPAGICVGFIGAPAAGPPAPPAKKTPTAAPTASAIRTGPSIRRPSTASQSIRRLG